MELKQAIESRASVRQFLPEPINPEHLKEMARLASLAPSVNNYQPWEFIAITNRALIERMSLTVRERIQALPENDSKYASTVKKQVEFFATFFDQAPAIIALAMEGYETVLEKGVVLSHNEINELRNFPDLQSAGACIQNFLLAAVDMGYGACWMSAPMIAANELDEMLEIREGYRLICFVAVGVPAVKQGVRPKKPIDNLFRLIV